MPKTCPADMSGVVCGKTSDEIRFDGPHCTHRARQLRKGKPFSLARGKRSPEELQRIRESGEACCRGCGRLLPLDSFSISRYGTPALDCKDCKALKHIERMYKLSPKDFKNLLKLQKDCCALCKAPDAGFGRRWHIDHDHSCCPGERTCGKCIRGALCLTCNARGLPWYEGLPKEMQTIEAINEYLTNPPGLRLARKEAP